MEDFKSSDDNTKADTYTARTRIGSYEFDGHIERGEPGRWNWKVSGYSTEKKETRTSIGWRETFEEARTASMDSLRQFAEQIAAEEGIA